jgi:hypothetical protein
MEVYGRDFITAVGRHAVVLPSVAATTPLIGSLGEILVAFRLPHILRE